MTEDGEKRIAELIAAAASLASSAGRDCEAKPRLLVEHCNPDRTVARMRDLLAEAGVLYDRGVPVRLVFDQRQKGTVAQAVTADALVLTAHTICRPFAVKPKGGLLEEADARLPRPLAVMYLDWRGEWRLPPFNGIATAPLLSEDGTVRSAAGYDAASGMWCEDMPDLGPAIPARPTLAEAATALALVRSTFKTFCFADADTVEHRSGMQVVDLSKPPGVDESSFLAALLTAVCRPSLHLAPAVLIRGAPWSGAGAGKGLLARCMCIIAFGRDPHAVTAGGSAQELEKRIAAELIEGNPALFLDNLNNTAINCDLLASVITERPARVRLLGRSQMLPLNASALVILTGNGVTVSEDLARRFLTVELDPRTENPEARRFASDIRVEVKQRRNELLVALLTIWRWGRLNPQLAGGLPLGSFEQWCRCVRDPLLALGCRDPAERVSEAKARDARRQTVLDLYRVWWTEHADHAVTASQLHESVRQAADPQARGRQYLAAHLEKLAGTRIGGLILTRQLPAGRWGAATYALKPTGEEHLHRDHREQPANNAPDGPYDAYAGASGADDGDGPSGPAEPEHRRRMAAEVAIQSPTNLGNSNWAPANPMNPMGSASPASGVYCEHCRDGDRAGNPLLPFGTERTGHTWLHLPCWSDRRDRGAHLASDGLALPAPLRPEFAQDFGKNGAA